MDNVLIIVMKLVYEICVPFKCHPLYYMRMKNKMKHSIDSLLPDHFVNWPLYQPDILVNF